MLNRNEGKDHSYNHDIVLSTNKLYVIESQLKQKLIDIDIEIKAYIQRYKWKK